MSIQNDTTESVTFVERVVVRHGFSDAQEWARGLDAISWLPDDYLDGLFGVSAAQRAADRELFDRIEAELGGVHAKT